MTPLRCVVDTNVTVTANDRNNTASGACVVASAVALQQVMARGHVFVDAAGEIIHEYRRNLAPFGEPRPGNVFLKWLLTHEWGGQRVTRVSLTRKAGAPDDFEELPSPPDGVAFDPSDRKFLAVAAAHEEHPVILQALDSKWWGWKKALAQAGVLVHFLCPDEIAKKHLEKSTP